MNLPFVIIIFAIILVNSYYGISFFLNWSIVIVLYLSCLKSVIVLIEFNIVEM